MEDIFSLNVYIKLEGGGEMQQLNIHQMVIFMAQTGESLGEESWLSNKMKYFLHYKSVLEGTFSCLDQTGDLYHT